MVFPKIPPGLLFDPEALDRPFPKGGDVIEGKTMNHEDLSPSPCPLPRGERVNKFKWPKNSLPLDGGGSGWG
jgi:hypothetical protein